MTLFVEDPVELLIPGDMVLLGDEPEQLLDIKREITENEADSRYEVFTLTFGRRIFEDNSICLFRGDKTRRLPRR